MLCKPIHFGGCISAIAVYAGLISCTGVTGRGGCYLDHAQNALGQVAALAYHAADEADWYVSLNAPCTVGSHAKSRPERLFREMGLIDHAHDPPGIMFVRLRNICWLLLNE